MIFFLFHIEIEGKCGWIIGGAKGYVGPPSQIIGGAWPPLAPPLPTPMSLVKNYQEIQLSVGSDKPRMLFFLLIEFKLSTTVGILTFMNKKKFMLNCVEHGNVFNLGP